jgi:hypothetical protein
VEFHRGTVQPPVRVKGRGPPSRSDSQRGRPLNSGRRRWRLQGMRAWRVSRWRISGSSSWKTNQTRPNS